MSTTQFERTVIQALIQGLQSRLLMAKLTVDFFETKQFRQVFYAIGLYYQKFAEVPLVDVLINEMRKMDIPQSDLGNIEAFLTKADAIRDDALQYAVEELEKAYLSRQLRFKMKEAVTLLEKGDPRQAQDVLLREVSSLSGAGRDVRILDFVDTFEARKEQILTRIRNPEIARQIFIPSGIVPLDNELDGGARKGELILILAPPASGKSIALQDISMRAVLQGYKVAFFTIEMTPEQTSYRLDSSLTQIKYHAFRRAELRDADFVEWEKKVKQIQPNQFKVIGVPGECSCRLIEAELARMAGTFKPDLVAVDYTGIMSPNEGKFESSMDWKYVGEILRNIKGLALKLNIPIWSAAQLLVGAKEKAEIRMTDIGLAKQQISAHTDVCVAIIQTKQMKAMGTTRLQFVKSREGCENTIVDIVSDYDRISLQKKTTDPEPQDAEKWTGND